MSENHDGDSDENSNENSEISENESDEDAPTDLIVGPHLYILGEPNGACEGCKRRWAEIRCWECGEGGWCNEWCESMSYDRRNHVCRQPIRKTKADNLLGGDVIPEDPVTRKLFYFDNCKTGEELSCLLGVYQTLHGPVTTFQFEEWMLAKEIHKNAVRVFKRYPDRVSSERWDWLKKLTHVFAASEEITEELGVHPFGPSESLQFLVPMMVC